MLHLLRVMKEAVMKGKQSHKKQLRQEIIDLRRSFLFTLKGDEQLLNAPQRETLHLAIKFDASNSLEANFYLLSGLPQFSEGVRVL